MKITTSQTLSRARPSTFTLLHDCACAPCPHQVRDQSQRLTKLHAEAQLLENSLQDSQRQAMALGSRLALTESKNDELLSQTQASAVIVFA